MSLLDFVKGRLEIYVAHEDLFVDVRCSLIGHLYGEQDPSGAKSPSKTKLFEYWVINKGVFGILKCCVLAYEQLKILLEEL